MNDAKNPEPKVQSFTAWAIKRGLTTDADVQSHIHAGLRSMPTTKTYARWNKATLERLQAERDAAKAAYRAAIEAGEIVEPVTTMEDRANGHPDNPSTQAARRVLEKRRARMAAEQAREARS